MPRSLGIQGEQYITNSDQFLEMETLPHRIIFIGGGYISFEFAHVALRAGAEVTILHRGERPLEGFDPDLVDQLVRKTKRLGGGVEVKVEVTAIERPAAKIRVNACTGSGQKAFEAEFVVLGAARVP